MVLFYLQLRYNRFATNNMCSDAWLHSGVSFLAHKRPQSSSIKRQVSQPAASILLSQTLLEASSGSSHHLPPMTMHHAALQVANMTRSLMFYSSLLGLDVLCRFRAGPAKAVWLGTLPNTNGTNSQDSIVSSDLSSFLLGMRLELIEIPPWMLTIPPTEQEGSESSTPRHRVVRAMDVVSRPTFVGAHHIALDVTAQVQAVLSQQNNTQSAASDRTNSSTFPGSTSSASNLPSPLTKWLSVLNATSVEKFGKSLRMAVPPRQQLIGRQVYELAFAYDPDGVCVEFISLQANLAPLESKGAEEADGWTPWDGTGFLGKSVVDDA
jgi:catechol 2,3-dioxygenase-like lactoylglutathione lyase family enzyme